MCVWTQKPRREKGGDSGAVRERIGGEEGRGGEERDGRHKSCVARHRSDASSSSLLLMARSPPLPLARFLAYLLLIFAGRAERPPTHLQRAILGQEEQQQRLQQQQQPQKKIVGRCTGAGEEKEKEGSLSGPTDSAQVKT